MQIAPPSCRAWWNATPEACIAWVARKFPLPRTPKASRTPSSASVRPTTSAAVSDSIERDLTSAIDLPAMRVGVGLPTTTPGADGALLVDWARKADAGPFSSLGVLDRLVYDSFDPFASLAAAAAVTTDVKLATMIAIGPVRPAAQLIKGAASVQALSDKAG